MGIRDLFSFGKSDRVKQLESQLNSMMQQNRMMVNNFGNSITQYPSWKTLDNATRYCTTDDIYSIINLISTTAASIPFYAYIKGADGKLTDAPENDELAMLLEQPFEGMSKFESTYAKCATMLMQGEWLAWKFKPEKGPNEGKVRLFYMAPQNVNIKVTTGYPRKILAYQYVDNGQIIMDNIPPAEVIHSKYFNPILGATGEELRGLSPLKVLSKRLVRVDSNMDVTTAQLQNGGIPGILFEKGDYAEITENAGRRKKDLYDYFSNLNNKGMPYSAGGDLGYIELGLKLADMEVADLAKIDFKKLCNVFCISDRLMNNDATGSEVSDKSARVGLYTNAVIPLLRRIRDSLSMGLDAEFPRKKYCIEYDTSEVPELQINMKEMADAFSALPIMIPSQILSAFKLGIPEDPNIDKIFIKSGYTLLEDEGLPLPNTGDYNTP